LVNSAGDPNTELNVERHCESGNIQAPAEEAKEARPWTDREMAEAEPYPLPEVSDEDATENGTGQAPSVSPKEGNDG
jgi:ABC-type uncharacterized transport system involved in gliding motility auxiliary subunit